MANAFAVNEVVELNSGGPPMTVEKIEGDRVTCVWFEGKKVHSHIFAAGTLKKHEPLSPVF